MSLKRFHVKRQTDSYTWSETEDFISISCHAKGMTLKHFDIFISDLFIKVNIPKIKHIIVWDLKSPIDFSSPHNRTTLANGQLDMKIFKKEQGEMWENLEYEGSKAAKLKRRNESIQRFEQWEKKKRDEQGETKVKLDKAALDKQMELEAWERSTLKAKKDEEKKYVEDQLYDDLEKMEGLNEKLKQGYDPKEVQREAQKISEESVHKLDPSNSTQKNITRASDSRSKYNDPSKNIFDDSDCVEMPKVVEDNSEHIKSLTGEIPEDERILKEFNQEESKCSYVDTIQPSEAVEEIIEEVPGPPVKPVELPEVRQGGSKKIEFSEKVYPNMPARESHKKEPPLPKSKKLKQNKDDKDMNFSIEDKDPVWLKDKGDHFFKRHDYNSAMNAYTKSIKNDPDFLMCYLNRGTTCMKMHNFEGALLDFDDIEKKINAESEEEKKDPFYARMMSRVLIKRGSCYGFLSNFEKAEEDLQKAMSEFKGLFSESELKSIESDLKKIKTRGESNEIKKKGDNFYGQGEFDSAIKEYQEAVKIDQTNEYALGNIGVIHMKRSDYQKCIEYTDSALNQINNFINETKSFKNDNQLEVKLLLRRGKSFQMIKEYEKAKKDLDECIRLDRRNKEAQSILKKVQGEINDILYKENKDEAERLFKEKEYSKALEHFEQCLRITRKASTLSNISVFVNKTACLFALKQNDLLITECNNALRLISNFKIKDNTKEDAEKAKKMEVILLLRKGKTLVEQNQIQKAIELYETALDIDPENSKIQEDIRSLKKSI
ncbi:unnamed protein product [Moneuplotes crassus]|uniref:CS domain-containing protein n=2 Tax=Euplotes crassus TaxID=5936 RepID=A0AAD1Y7X3_EUPCR|nr:unnamed protein product [Moneuplotes crassus]